MEKEVREKCRKLLLAFFGCTSTQRQQILIDFLHQETKCTSAYILRHCMETKTLRYYTKNSPTRNGHQDINITDWMYGAQLLRKGEPVVLSSRVSAYKATVFRLRLILHETPTTLLCIPACTRGSKCFGLVCITYKVGLFEKGISSPESLNFSLPQLHKCINLVVPHLMKTQEAEDASTTVNRQAIVLNCIDLISANRFIGSSTAYISEIASQIQLLVPCQKVAIFTHELEGNNLVLNATPGVDKKIIKKFCSAPSTHINATERIEAEKVQTLFWVVKNSKTLRINDPSDCKRFRINKYKETIHTTSGCLVKNVMCFPIHDVSNKKPVFIEMTDKVGGFSFDDELTVAMYAKYLAPGLTTAVLQCHRQKRKRGYAIFDDVTRHVVPISNEDFHQLNASKFSFNDSFNTYTFCVKSLQPVESTAAILFIFTELGLLSRWHMHKSTVIRFILCTQRGYNDLPYHNWWHACSVAHYSYLLVTTLKLVENKNLSDIEVLSLIIASITHDIDHRGFNNHFQLCTHSFLSTLYNEDESIMERHHLAVAMAILSRDDCNVVEYLSEKDYADFVRLLSWNILATDIGKHLKCRDDLFETCNTLEKVDGEYHMALLSCCMTMSDLCDVTKPWNDGLPTVKSVFTEFFNQGDEEKRRELKPSTMMDRNQAYIPIIEISFLQYVGRPVYDSMSSHFELLRQCVDAIDHQVDLWYLATTVFDEYNPKNDILDIFQLATMKEESLWKKYDPELLEHLRAEKFAVLQTVSHSKTSTRATLREPHRRAKKPIWKRFCPWCK